MIGQTVSHFRILDKLGGVVQKAGDIWLGQNGARLFLPCQLHLDHAAHGRGMYGPESIAVIEHLLLWVGSEAALELDCDY